MQKESKVADIDERIAKIESLVGSSSGNGFDDLVSKLYEIPAWKTYIVIFSASQPCHFFYGGIAFQA